MAVAYSEPEKILLVLTHSFNKKETPICFSSSHLREYNPCLISAIASSTCLYMDFQVVISITFLKGFHIQFKLPIQATCPV